MMDGPLGKIGEARKRGEAEAGDPCGHDPGTSGTREAPGVFSAWRGGRADTPTEAARLQVPLTTTHVHQTLSKVI